jgi:hypothetical protein
MNSDPYPWIGTSGCFYGAWKEICSQDYWYYSSFQHTIVNFLKASAQFLPSPRPVYLLVYCSASMMISGAGHRWRRDAESGKAEAVPPFLCGSGSPLPGGRSNTSSGVSVHRLRYGWLYHTFCLLTCLTWMNEACPPCRRVAATSSRHRGWSCPSRDACLTPCLPPTKL